MSMLSPVLFFVENFYDLGIVQWWHCIKKTSTQIKLLQCHCRYDVSMWWCYIKLDEVSKLAEEAHVEATGENFSETFAVSVPDLVVTKVAVESNVETMPFEVHQGHKSDSSSVGELTLSKDSLIVNPFRESL